MAKQPLRTVHIPNLMSIATSTKVGAIHPGYGFLAENTELAEIREKFNIVFIGPDAEAIRKMGEKQWQETR